MIYFLVTFPILLTIYFLILYGIKVKWMKSNNPGSSHYKWTHHALIGIAGSIPLFSGIERILWFLFNLFVQYDDLYQHTYFKQGIGPLRLIFGKFLILLFPLWLVETFLDWFLNKYGSSPLHEVGRIWYSKREKLYYYLEAKGGIWNKIAQKIIRL